MDIKKTWAFFVLYLIDLALSQSILDLLGSSGESGTGGAGCPLGSHPDRRKFVQGGVIRDCAGGTMFDLNACACINIQPAGVGGDTLGFSNLLSRNQAGGGLPDPLSSGLSGGLGDIFGGGGANGGLESLFSGGAGGGAKLGDMFSRGGGGGHSAGGLSDILMEGGASGASSEGGLEALLAGGGGLSSLLSGSGGAKGGGGLGDLLVGGGGQSDPFTSRASQSGGASGATDAALNALLSKLTRGQGDAGTPVGPSPTVAARPDPIKAARGRDAMRRIRERLSGSKPSSLRGQIKEQQPSSNPGQIPSSLPSAVLDLMKSGNGQKISKTNPTTAPKTTRFQPEQREPRRQPTPTASSKRRLSSSPAWSRPSSSTGRTQQPIFPPSRPPSMSPPTRRSRIPSSGSSAADPVDKLLQKLGVHDPTFSGSSGRSFGGSRGSISKLGGIQGTADFIGATRRRGTGAESRQGTSPMAQLLASIEGSGRGSASSIGIGGGIPHGGALLGAGGTTSTIESLLTGLSGGLGSGSLGALGGAASLGGAGLGVGQIPDLTSILNRRGEMMPIGTMDINAIRNINPATLAALDRQGVVDISDLRPRGMLALAKLLGPQR